MATLKRVSIRNTTLAPRMFYGGEDNATLIRVMPNETVEALVRAKLIEDVAKARARDGDAGEVEITILGDGPEESPPPAPKQVEAVDDEEAEIRQASPPHPAHRHARPAKGG
jgi:hypothetical protein